MEKNTIVGEPVVGGRARFRLSGQLGTNPSLLMLVRELRSSLSGCRTILDLGCGNASPLRFVPQARLTGLDGYPPALAEARQTRTHDELVPGAVTAAGALFSGRKFDACVALDVIEHLQKADGWKMLETMERLAQRRVIIFTPNGFVPQASKDGDLQEHLSGWTAEEMRARGYEVLGMYGPKSLRGEYHRILRQPRPVWLLISFLGHFLHTRSRPERAAAIFCVKDLPARSQA